MKSHQISLSESSEMFKKFVKFNSKDRAIIDSIDSERLKFNKSKEVSNNILKRIPLNLMIIFKIKVQNFIEN
jgi:hypothetical protein